jgi:hypothetical protein
VSDKTLASKAKGRAKLRRSQSQEKGIARDTGGRRTPGSGSQEHAKGDVKEDEWLIEAKQTVSPRYSLTLSTWRQIEVQAIRASRSPALVVEMAGRKLVVIDYNTFLSMRGNDHA